MAYETIIAERSRHIATITLNRPDRLNSFTRAMHAELRDALGSLGDARVLVLTGAGRGFCAGQDLNDRAVAPGEAVDLGETVEECWNPLVRTLAELPQPVIAKVNGVAAGAGASLAMACDIVIAASTAKFIQSFSALGLVPDTGGSWHLTRHLGQARAMGLALTGEPLDARRPKNGASSGNASEASGSTRKRTSSPPSWRPSRPWARRNQEDHPHQLGPIAQRRTRFAAGRDAPPRLHRGLS
ncbi:enoyl-CoA hydratase-related protein [Sphingomonas sp. HDW15A]|uniref:enoyl-CoA hydratase-related protein n=1 Tax=Sphingomonas sp. HDW15A TaxID=2714942 RepID=UPI001F0E8574|nr:enoyl-CoA hydratase-related protein [Sphingomonas sp. HDW15A]